MDNPDKIENKKGPSIIFIILAIIIGSGLWREIDFANQTVKNPALAAVYLITFAVCVSLIVKSYKKQSRN